MAGVILRMQKVEINDLVAHLDSLCASITSAWKILQVHVNPFSLHGAAHSC
jgi:hypothetical protein